MYPLTASCFCILQIEEPRIARLIDGRIVIGRDLGHTNIQVFFARFITKSATHLFPFNCN